MRVVGTVLPLVLASAAVALSCAAAAFSPAASPSQPVCKGEEGYSATFGGRRTFFLKADQLVAIKAVRDTDPVVAAAYRILLRQADAALARRPGAVTDKTTLPPSGDRHDYLSIAPYWWPVPGNPHAPYVRRDGEFNPARDTQSYDRTAIGRMSGDVRALALAYYYSDDTRYAKKAAELIRTWFLDPATAMNPNANFAQAVRGREDGRAEGVLDTNAFQPVVDAIGLLAPSRALTPEEGKALERWFGRYVDWMLKSRNGRAEQAAKNNHGIWFDSQITQYALFARRSEVARKVVDQFATRRISAQMDADGRLPAELARTRSLHYSIYALMPAYDVAEMATCLGTDLWGHADAKGRGLRKATDFLAAYRGKLDKWPYKELRLEPQELDELLTRASWAWGPGSYPRKADGYPAALEYRADAPPVR
ncbi:alginate lyase family protein [Sphingomonas sp. R86521]|uniref:alginate lyase family protein n=1 Tax=Sphingomonas sp. R86521 TaxID=3093860 RepID=UPI0036D40C1F